MNNTAKDRFGIFFNLMNYFLKIFILLITFFISYRLVFCLRYGKNLELGKQIGEIFQAFFTGLRFDVVVITYGMLLPLFLILSTLIISPKIEKWRLVVKKFVQYFSYLLFLVFLIISLIDFFFYQFFQYHINILFFGIINDDTINVLKSVWTDYPILWILLIISASMLLWILLIKKIFKKEYENPIKSIILKSTIVFLFLILYAVGMRGSLGTFPLENEDGVISDNTFINAVTMNGVFSLKIAFEEKGRQTIDTNQEKSLAANGFNSAEEALAAYLSREKIQQDSLLQYLQEETRENDFLKQNPPNVVFIQMESFGAYYLSLHQSELNLLGNLEKQLKDCYVFTNFLSATGGTIHTLEGLLVGSPLTPLSQSTYMNCSLNTSVALPYKENGYQTNFITSSELGWRNIDKFIPYQYFDNVEGCESILKKIPSSQRCEWGAYDEFMFDRIFQILQSSKKSNFVFAMTTTNHTPYTIPENYKAFPVKISKEMQKELRTDLDIASKNMTNYQYANNSLGLFIEKVRNSPLGENTIIAASGDHNTLALFSFPDKNLLQKFSVPFILYVPEKYKPKNKVNTNIFASHKDIFPTLFTLSLSKTKYIKTGLNLLDSLGLDNSFGIINYSFAMNEEGCVNIPDKLYFSWTDSSRRFLQPSTPEKSPKLLELMLKARGYTASLTWQIQNELKKCKK